VVPLTVLVMIILFGNAKASAVLVTAQVPVAFAKARAVTVWKSVVTVVGQEIVMNAKGAGKNNGNCGLI